MRPRLERRALRTVNAHQAGWTELTTDALGYLDASEHDQQRWAVTFRALLDGLDTPLQVVMRFRIGTRGVSTAPASTASPPTSCERMRAADLEFKRALAEAHDTQRRQVKLVVREDSRATVVAQLAEMGLRAETKPTNESPVRGLERRSYVEDDEGWHRTWCVDRFPGVDLSPGWLIKLVPPNLNVTISWHANPLSTAWMIDFLQRQLTNMRANRMLAGEGGRSDPLAEGALPNVVDLQRRLAASQERAYQVSLYVTLSAATKESLQLDSAHILAAGRSALCRLQPCTFRMLDARVATLPRGLNPLGRARILDTSSLTTLLPWLDADLQQPNGLVLGRSKATGEPVSLDPFDTDRFENANIGVFGHSGAGKTYLLSTLMMGAVGRGAQVLVFDPEREYGGLAQQLGGVEIDLTLGGGHALNVLAPQPPGGIDDAWLGPVVAEVADLVGIVCGGVDEGERALLEEAIRQTYGSEREPVLRDVADRLPAPSRVSQVLQRWISGSLGRIFSAPTNIDLDAPVVSFALRELREEMIAPVHFLIAEALWSRIRSRSRQRLLVVDELGLLFDDPTIRRFVVTLARRIRKYEGGLVFATQNPGDLLASEAGAVVATNPAIHFFGAQRPGEAARLQRTFQLSESQRRRLETARRGDFILAAGPDRIHLHVQAPPWQERVMTSSRDRAHVPGPLPGMRGG